MSRPTTAMRESIRAAAAASATPTVPTQNSSADGSKYNLSELAAEILFGVVDLKVSKGNPILLEFGDGYSSGFMDTKQLMESLKQCLQNKLKLSLYTDQQIRAQRELVLELINKKAPTLSDYLCVYHRAHGTYFQNLKNSKVMAINNHPLWYLICILKNMMTEIVSRAGCSEMLPPSKTYGFESDVITLAARMRKDIPGAKTYVLKAPCSTRGEGVFIVDNEDLEITLPILLQGDKEELDMHFERYREALKNKKLPPELDQDIAAAKQWRMQAGAFPEFLVQEYCASDLLEIEGKKYDPTLRIGFTITLNKGKVEFHPLDSYWKVPIKPVGEGGLRKRTVSNVHHPHGRVKTDIKTQNEVFEQLKPFMVKIFEELFRTNVSSYIDSLISNASASQQLQGVMLAIYYAQGLNKLYQFDDTLEMLKKLGSRVTSFNSSYATAFYCQTLGEAQLFTRQLVNALNTLTIALSTSSSHKIPPSTLAALYLTRAITYGLLDLKAESVADLKSAWKCKSNENILRDILKRMEYIFVSETLSAYLRGGSKEDNALKTVWQMQAITMVFQQILANMAATSSGRDAKHSAHILTLSSIGKKVQVAASPSTGNGVQPAASKKESSRRRKAKRR